MQGMLCPHYFTQQQRYACTHHTNFKYFLEQLKQLCMTKTNSHNTSSHHKRHQNNTDRHKHKYHNKDTKHNGNYNRNRLYSGNTHNRTHHSRHNHRTRINGIEDFNECHSDCTDLSECKEQVNTETPGNTNN